MLGLHQRPVPFSAGTRSVRPCLSRPPFAPSRVVAPRRTRLVPCNGLFGLGLPEIAVIAGIAALVFGPSKLPELGKGLGKTLKSFQSAAKEFESELKTASAPDGEVEKKEEKKEEKKP